MHQLTVLTLVLVALCSLRSVDSSAYDKIVTHSRIRARKEGPNVCALQQVLGTNKKYFSTCRNWYKGTICGKKAVVLYECCPGYMNLEGMKGCPAVAPIDHVYGTLGLVKATTTQQYTDMSKLREEIEGKGSFTMFAPSNEAWDQLAPEMRSALESNVNIELYNALHFHMVNRRFLTKDLKNDITVTSMYNDLGLYINHYSNGIVTVNCARIIHGNQVATNGVVHVIDRVIGFVSNTIKGVLDVNDDLTSFSAAALASGMMDKLDQPGHYTLFAPTNEAFDKLAPGHLERIMGDKDVIAALVNYHLLNSVQCSEAIMSGSTYETAEGSTIEIGCDGNSLTVNGIKMVLKKDIVTSNGVIHLIDKVLIPDSAKEVMELVGETQSTFSDMVSELGLAAALGPKREYTLLAPVNTAFTKEVMSTDQSFLKYILENHILKLKITLNELYNGQLLETLAGKLLRVFIYRTAVCIENACMMRGGKEGSNGALHVMKSLITPAEKTIYQLLVIDGRFKIFLSLMETAGLTDLLKQEGSYTIFAPTDDAFEGLSREDFTLLKSDLNALRVILLYHFSNGVFINGGLEGGVTNLLKTIQGNNLQVTSVNNSILVNSVGVPDSDLMATNGVIHVVKNVLYPADLPVGRQDLLVLLKKLIKYIQIKFVSGFSYSEIPLTFISSDPIKVIRVIEGEPSITTRVIEGGDLNVDAERIAGGDLNVDAERIADEITRVVQGDPSKTEVTRVIQGDPSFKKVTRVIQGNPSQSTVTRVIDGQSPTIFTRVIEGGDLNVDAERIADEITRVVQGDPSKTEVTRVIQGDPSFKKVTRVIKGKPSQPTVTRVIDGQSSTKVMRVTEGGDLNVDAERIADEITRIVQGDPSKTEVTRVIQGDPSFKKVTRVIQGNPSQSTVTRVIDGQSPTIFTRVIEGGDLNIDAERIADEITRVVQGDPSKTEVTRVIQGDPSFKKVTRVIKGKPSQPTVTRVIDGQSSTKVTRVIEGGDLNVDGKRIAGGARFTAGSEPYIIEVPDLTRITTIHGNPNLIDEESERITKIIQEGGKFAAARKGPAGMRRRARLVRRHHKTKQ
ncbi:periostin isoform X5 [Labrus bergylta]|uniref:periostin isoform X5 n=1 Tax=Labrus bergylta TaxID=56723 RepID=UPI003313848F